MYKRLFAIALTFGMSALAPPAHAMNCAPRDSVVERLQKQFKETLTARGLQNQNALIEIFTSTESGSYTVLMSRPDGVSCVISSGTHWLPAEPIPAGVAG